MKHQGKCQGNLTTYHTCQHVNRYLCDKCSKCIVRPKRLANGQRYIPFELYLECIKAVRNANRGYVTLYVAKQLVDAIFPRATDCLNGNCRVEAR